MAGREASQTLAAEVAKQTLGKKLAGVYPCQVTPNVFMSRDGLSPFPRTHESRSACLP